MGGRTYFVCGDGTRKVRLLTGSPPVSPAVNTGRPDVVIEGRAERVREENLAEEVAWAYPAVNGWAPASTGCPTSRPKPPWGTKAR